MKRIIEKNFPKIDFGFGYGSGIFQQFNQKKNGKMKDFIFVVQNSQTFHEENLKRNQHHYSFISRLFGSSFINFIQKNGGGHLYYNTFIKLKENEDEIIIKYGVMDMDDFKNDLLNWNTMYVSGRLHKPVLILFQENQKELLKENLKNAFLISLYRLMSKEKEEYSFMELFHKVCSLSYEGDIRMNLNMENSNKVENIIKGSYSSFKELYSPFFTFWIQETKEEKFNIIKTKQEILQEITIPQFENLKSIVRKSSIIQSLKGVLSIGISKSMKYLIHKIKSSFTSYLSVIMVSIISFSFLIKYFLFLVSIFTIGKSFLVSLNFFTLDMMEDG
jgi:mitochondrial translocator assembly and maintenance protein 41